MYQWLLFGHLVGVGVLLAGLGVHVINVGRLRQARTVPELRVLLATAKYGEWMVLIGAALLVAAGLTLAARFWSFSDGWIATSIGLVIAQGLAGSIVDRQTERLRGALRTAPDGALSTELTVLTRNPLLHAANRISVAIIVEILFLMTVKPAVLGILWSLLAAAGVGTILSWPVFTQRPGQLASPTELARKDVDSAEDAARPERGGG
ncbi:MAG: hypothetical protein ACRDG9_07330 [Actinomycetota bacterium]